MDRNLRESLNEKHLNLGIKIFDHKLTWKLF